jgi:hypothetical protein
MKNSISTTNTSTNTNTNTKSINISRKGDSRYRANKYESEITSYSRFYKYYRIVGYITLMISIGELVIGTLLHQVIQGAGIGSWWASLNPLMASLFSLNISSGSRLAAMLINAILGVISGLVGCAVEIAEYRRFNSLEACYDSQDNIFFSFYNSSISIPDEQRINTTCPKAFVYYTETPAYDCFCIDNTKRCINYDIGRDKNTCQSVFSPIPTSSVTLKYAIVSAAFCVTLSMLCLTLSIMGCQNARIEEDDDTNPLKVVNSSNSQGSLRDVLNAKIQVP